MKLFAFAALAGLLFAGASGVAHADTLDLTIDQPSGTAPGGTLAYFATVTAPATNTGTVYLNSDAFNVSGDITLDDTPYISYFPLSLNPGQSYSGELFDVNVAADVLAGTYAGYFSVLGGGDSSALSMLTTTDFSVNVTPEPSSLLLLATGLLAFGWMPLRIRRARS